MKSTHNFYVKNIQQYLIKLLKIKKKLFSPLLKSVASPQINLTLTNSLKIDFSQYRASCQIKSFTQKINQSERWPKTNC